MTRVMLACLVSSLLLGGCHGPSESKAKPQTPRCDDAVEGSGVVEAQLRQHQRSLHTATDPAASLTRVGNDWIRLARVRTEPRLYAEAQACAREALLLAPEDAGARVLQAFVLLEEHRFREADRVARALLARDTDNPVAWSLVSDAQLELGDLDAAMDAAQRMLDLKPNLPSYGRAAHLRWLQGDSAGAKLLYQQAIHAGEAQKDPEPRAWMIVQAAWLFWHEGDYRGAQAGFDAALAQLPKYAPALEGKGKAALALGDYVDAVRWLEQAYQAHPLIETAWWLGDAYQLKGDAAQARKYHERVERDGERLDPRTLALYLATRDREPEKALRLARAEHAQRADVWSKDVLAWASYRAGLLQDALKLSAEALAHGTKDARLLYHAGVIRRAAGASAEGDALIEQATRLNPYFDRILLGRTDGTLAQNP